MIGRDVIYRTDGRNGLVYDLPAKITVTRDTHPGDYPDGRRNPLPVPDEGCVHLTVFTPGGFGTELVEEDERYVPGDDSAYVGAAGLYPGSGTYVEWNVPYEGDVNHIERTWRWPERTP